jgi:hypothetical protein
MYWWEGKFTARLPSNELQRCIHYCCPHSSLRVCLLQKFTLPWFYSEPHFCNYKMRMFIIEPEYRSWYSDSLRTGRPRDRSSSPSGHKIFILSTSIISVLGPIRAPIQWVPRAPSPEVKQPRREADRSSPTSAEVKNTWIYTSTHPYVFMGG